MQLFVLSKDLNLMRLTKNGSCSLSLTCSTMAVDIGLVVDREIEGFLGFVIGVGVDLGVDLGVDEGVGVVRGVVIGVGKGVGDDLGVVTGDAIGGVKGELFLKIENPVD